MLIKFIVHQAGSWVNSTPADSLEHALELQKSWPHERISAYDNELNLWVTVKKGESEA